MTKSTYLFIQKLSTNKFLDLDDDEYGRNSHRYRTRVDANAATLELLCLSCDDETGRFLSNEIIFDFFQSANTQIFQKRMKDFLVCIVIEILWIFNFLSSRITTCDVFQQIYLKEYS